MGLFAERYNMGFYSDLDIEIAEFAKKATPEQIRVKYPFLTEDDIVHYLERQDDGEVK